MSNYEDMNKEQLQEELARRELPTSGNKDDLVARLELNDAEQESEDEPEGEPDQESEGGEESEETPESDPGTPGQQQATTAPQRTDVAPVTSAAASAGDEGEDEDEDDEAPEPVEKRKRANRFTSPGFDPVEEKDDPREEVGDLIDVPGGESRMEQAFTDVEQYEDEEIDESAFGHLPPQKRPSAHGPVGMTRIHPDGRRQRLVRAGASDESDEE